VSGHGSGDSPRSTQRHPAVPSPSGVGMASERARARMVEALRSLGIRSPVVLEIMGVVPRHLFIEQALASRAYEDVSLPIGHGQTISKPSTVARMIEIALAHLDAPGRRSANILEIGTGCGYQAAVLAQLCGQVVSIERVRALHELARANLRALRIPNLRLVYGDGRAGVPQAAPYDAIIVAAAAGDEVPEELLPQMKVGSRLIAPVGVARQALHLVERTGKFEWGLTVLDAVRFVPLQAGKG